MVGGASGKRGRGRLRKRNKGWGMVSEVDESHGSKQKSFHYFVSVERSLALTRDGRRLTTTAVTVAFHCHNMIPFSF